MARPLEGIRLLLVQTDGEPIDACANAFSRWGATIVIETALDNAKRTIEDDAGAFDTVLCACSVLTVNQCTQWLAWVDNYYGGGYVPVGLVSEDGRVAASAKEAGLACYRTPYVNGLTRMLAELEHADALLAKT